MSGSTRHYDGFLLPKFRSFNVISCHEDEYLPDPLDDEPFEDDGAYAHDD